MHKFVIFVLAICSSILSIQSVDRAEFRNLGSHYERNTFSKDANFENFIVEDLLNRNLTKDDYKILTKLGLKQYFKLVDAIKENKKIAVGNYIIPESLNFTKATTDSNMIFDGVHGFSAVKIENPQVNSILDSKFEIRSVIHLPQLIFYGHLVDKNKPIEYKLEEVSFVITEYKKVDDNFHIESIQSSEEVHFNKNDLTIDEKTSNRSLDREAQQIAASYLAETTNFLRTSTANYWAGADNWYLRQRKDQMLDKLFKIVLKTVKTYSNLGCEVPRFSFRDQKTSVNYEMINGYLELEGGSIRSLMKNVNENGDIEMAFPLSGSLRYYVSELNCTSLCHFYGHRFQVTKADVRINFVNNRIQSVPWIFEMKYMETLVDNRLKAHNDEAFNVVLEKVSKVVSERFLIFLKSFLGPEFF